MTRSSGTKWVPKASELAGWDLAAKLAQQAQGGTAAPSLPAPQHIVAVPVVNTTGDTLPHLSCVAFKDPSILPTDDVDQFRFGVVFDAVEPPSDLSGYQLGILMQDLPSDGVGLALIQGATAVRITGTGSYATATTGDTSKLTAGAAGWKILYQESGSSERWAVVILSDAVAESCANVFTAQVYGGPTAGTMSWALIDLEDESTVCSGTYTFGDSYTTIKSVIDAALGYAIPVNGGPLPGNGIVVHANRGRSSTRYDFRATFSLTPQADIGAFGVVARCCTIGG